MSRTLWTLILALPALLAGPNVASATSLGPLTEQVNSPGDAPYSVGAPSIVEDRKGGFVVLWDKEIGDDDGLSDRIFARFYKKGGKPEGPARRLDRTIQGLKPREVGIAGGLRTETGRLVAIYNDIFEVGSPRGVTAVNQIFDGDGVVGAAKFVAPGRPTSYASEPTPLQDGAGLITWTLANHQGRGALVAPDGSLRDSFDLRAKDRFFVETVSLDRGFFAIYLGADDLVGQAHDADGGKDGRLFALPIDPNDVGNFDLKFVGLATGGVVLITGVKTPDGRGDVVAQWISRTGKTIGKPKTIATGVFPDRLFATRLADAGFLIVVNETSAGAPRPVYMRFDSDLKQVGLPAKGVATPGLLLTGMRLLTNGNVASGYRIDNADIRVQIVEP